MNQGGLPGMVAAGFGVALLAWVPAADIKVTPVVADGAVSVSFVAPTAISPAGREFVQSGLLMTLTFSIELKEPSTAWFDRSLAEVDVASSVKFDNLTGVYHVSRMRDGHVVWSERTSDFGTARGWLTTFDRVPLSSEAQLRPNNDYYVSVRMRTSPRRTFPLWPWTPDDSHGRAAFTFIR